MKPQTALTGIVILFLLGFAAMATAQGNRGCSYDRVAGEWGYTKTGTIILPTGPAPFASVGKFALGADASLSGTNDGSVGGGVSKDVLAGSFTLNSDCTGTATIGVYDTSEKLLRTIVMAIVIDDDMGEIRGIVTSLALPNGVSLPSIITAQATRLTRNHGDR